MISPTAVVVCAPVPIFRGGGTDVAGSASSLLIADAPSSSLLLDTEPSDLSPSFSDNVSTVTLCTIDIPIIRALLSIASTTWEFEWVSVPVLYPSSVVMDRCKETLPNSSSAYSPLSLVTMLRPTLLITLSPPPAVDVSSSSCISISNTKVILFFSPSTISVLICSFLLLSPSDSILLGNDPPL